MAVLCEASSVIIRTQSVEEKFTGGRKGFHESVPNRTYCSDGELERVGFLTPDDVGEFIDVLSAINLYLNQRLNAPRYLTSGVPGIHKQVVGYFKD